jgi:ribose transport system substrate-binding protein
MRANTLRAAAVSAVIAVGLFAVGCGGSDSDSGSSSGAAAGATETSADKPVRVAFVSTVANTFTQGIYKGFQDAAKGKDVEVKMFDAGTDPQKEFNTIQSIVAQKQFDAIAVLPLDAVSIVPAVKQAIDAKIKVVSFNNPLGERYDTLEPQVPGQTAVVMDASQFQRGIWMAEMAVDACEGIDPCEVAWLSGLAGIAGEQALVDGYKKGLSSASNVKLATVRAAGGYTAELGRTASQNILQANSGIDVIAGSDQLIHGAQLAVDSAKVNGKVKLIGLGGSKIAINGIKSGAWYGTVVTLPYDVGVKSLEAVVAGVRENKDNQAVDVIESLGMDPKLTKDNLGDFKPQWDG